MTIEAQGESAWIIRMAKLPDEDAATRLQDLADFLSQPEFQGRLEPVLAFDSMTVIIDDPTIDREEAEHIIAASLQETEHRASPPRRLHRIPVCYDHEFGLDLNEMASMTGLSCESIVEMHSAPTYSVRMIGFAPGFPYLSGLPKALCVPRRKVPRAEVAAGSVAIGGEQTGIYPNPAPGGWRIIGRTPLRLFDVQRPVPSTLMPGDQVHFYSVDRNEFARILNHG